MWYFVGWLILTPIIYWLVRGYGRGRIMSALYALIWPLALFDILTWLRREDRGHRR